MSIKEVKNRFLTSRDRFTSSFYCRDSVQRCCNEDAGTYYECKIHLTHFIWDRFIYNRDDCVLYK